MKFNKYPLFLYKNLRINIYQILIILLFYANFAIRIDTFKSPHYHYQGDYNRDYLIANHIVRYRELPLRGPYGELGPASESPIYYYFLAALLFLGENDIIFLGFMNLLLQILTLIIVYFMAKSMFDRQAAFITVLLFGFSQGIVSQSGFVWQPHILQPFVNFSYLLLFLSYKMKNYWLLLFSILIFVLSLALYYPTLAIIPMYLFLAVLILAIQKRSYQYYLGAFLTVIVSFVILYSPLIIYLFKNSHSNSPQIITKFIEILRQPLNVVIQNLITRTGVFLNFFFFNSRAIIDPFPLIIVSAFLLTMAFYFFFLRIPDIRKYYSAIILCSILSFLVIAAFNTTPSLITFPTRHFTPIFGLFVIFISEIINLVFSGKLILRTAKILVIIFLLLEFTNQGKNLSIKSNFMRLNPFDLFIIRYIENPAVEAVKNEIITIQHNERKMALDFFQFISYRNGYEDRFVNEVFWRPLEKEFNQKLTRVNDDNYHGYEPISSNEYLFLRCQFIYDEKEECIDPFLKDHPNYFIVKKIFLQHPSVYLTRRADTINLSPMRAPGKG